MAKKRAVMPDKYIQIDVMQVVGEFVVCNLYTGLLCIPITMRKSDYEYLIQKGFFIRDGKTVDSAGVINTTDSYFPEE